MRNSVASFRCAQRMHQWPVCARGGYNIWRVHRPSHRPHSHDRHLRGNHRYIIVRRWQNTVSYSLKTLFNNVVLIEVFLTF